MSGALIIAALVIIGILVYLYMKRGQMGFEIGTYKKPFPDLQKYPLETCPRVSRTVELPLRYDNSTGVYMTKIRMGDDNKSMFFNVVPDTGSSILLLNGPNCDGCNSADGVWDTSVGKDMSNGQTGVIRYGGQQVTIYTPWRGKFFDDNLDDTDGFEVDFGLIRKSTSPDNKPLQVLGIQGGKSFLQALCGDRIVTLDLPAKKLILGATDVTNGKTVYKTSMVPSPSAVNFNVNRIISMKVNGTTVPSPNYAVIDTGATQTLVDSGLGNYLKTPGTVEITFAGPNGNVVIPFNNRSGTVSAERTPFPSSIVIGNRWLSDYGVQLDYENNEINYYR